MVEFWEDWIKKYPIFSLEDPLAEDDWEAWQKLTQKIGKQALVVGDDLTVTSLERIKRAITEKALNAVLIKMNQIGTITETLAAVKLCREHNLKCILSHRSGETEDAFIADLCVGLGIEYCKFGGPDRGERTCKYNRLLRIEEKMGGE